MLSDGAKLLVTNGRGAYRNGNLFDRGIPPDIPVEETGKGDAVLAAAIAWLQAFGQHDKK